MNKPTKIQQRMIDDASAGACPFCSPADPDHHSNIDYDNLVVDYGAVTQLAHCQDCGARWMEVYRMTEIERIEK